MEVQAMLPRRNRYSIIVCLLLLLGVHCGTFKLGTLIRYRGDRSIWDWDIGEEFLCCFGMVALFAATLTLMAVLINLGSRTWLVHGSPALALGGCPVALLLGVLFAQLTIILDNARNKQLADVIVLALERHRTERGEYPEQLHAIADINSLQLHRGPQRVLLGYRRRSSDRFELAFATGPNEELEYSSATSEWQQRYHVD
jgi:hypothetical protein